MDRKQKQSIRQAIIEGIRRNGNRIFDLSQNTAACYVPVNTGNLKRSGICENIPGGIRIGYRAPYSADVEFGIEEDRPITGTQTVHVGSHRRRRYSRRDGTVVRASTVRAHDVTYKNKRLIGFRPKYAKFAYGDKIFRVIDSQKARPGQFFLARAVREGIKDLAKDVEFSIRQRT